MKNIIINYDIVINSEKIVSYYAKFMSSSNFPTVGRSLDKTRYSNPTELIDRHTKASSSSPKALYRHGDKEEFYKNMEPLGKAKKPLRLWKSKLERSTTIFKIYTKFC